jgi:hypothetical protein
MNRIGASAWRSGTALAACFVYLFCTYTDVFQRFWRLWIFDFINILAIFANVKLRIPPSAPVW